MIVFTGPIDYKEYNQFVLATTPDHSHISTKQDYGNGSCFGNLLFWYSVWAIQEWRDNNTCTFYRKKTMALSLQVEITETTRNTSLWVKFASDKCKYNAHFIYCHRAFCLLSRSLLHILD